MRAICIAIFLVIVICSFTSPCAKYPFEKTGSGDTCFYELLLPPDLDLPETPHFDTTFVRNRNCKVQIVLLQTWGTETEYTLRANIDNKEYSRKAHFWHGSDRAAHMIDITDLPNGSYSGYLLACGNGGGFSLQLR